MHAIIEARCHGQEGTSPCPVYRSVEPGIAPKSGHPGSAESTQSGKSVMALDYHVYHTKIHSTESYIQFN